MKIRCPELRILINWPAREHVIREVIVNIPFAGLPGHPLCSVTIQRRLKPMDTLAEEKVSGIKEHHFRNYLRITVIILPGLVKYIIWGFQ
ncbi:hypothetical protein D3C87_1801640 [compost metagenome]